VSADPYAAPRTLPGDATADSGANAMLGALAAVVAVAVAGMLVLLALVQPRTAFVHSPEFGVALGMLGMGLLQYARRTRGQAACYLLAAVAIATVFGLFRPGLLEGCAIACVLASLIAARSTAGLSDPQARKQLPLLACLVFGAAGWGLASLAIWLDFIEAPLASVLGLNRFGMPLLMIPIWGFAAAAIASALIRGLCRGRLYAQWLLFVVGGIAYHVALGIALDYILPNTYAPTQIKDVALLAAPFALGGAAGLGWRRWRPRPLPTP
jgi:hypothetical protein